MNKHWTEYTDQDRLNQILVNQLYIARMLNNLTEIIGLAKDELITAGHQHIFKETKRMFEDKGEH